MRIVCSFILAVIAASAQVHEITGDRIRAHTRFLASDFMEGRGVGARGGDLATEYLATQLALIGAKPAGDNGTYYQSLTLIGSETKGGEARLTANGAGKSVDFKWAADFVGGSQRQQPLAQFDAEAIFVGHGISAPEFNWDDYKGIDVRGKVVVVFTNEPPSSSDTFFGGRALTYYGRWTYKYEEAARRGAVACLIIHTTPTAGYGWEVVRSSWGNEDPQVKLAAGDPALAFAGWLTQEAAGGMIAPSGQTVDGLLKAAGTPGFRPMPLNLTIKGHIPTTLREIRSRNVVGILPGGHRKDEAVLFTAHWDHLGIGEPVNGDRIYNGAVDNATGCAMVLEIARAWAALDQKPRRSAIVAFVTAEEAGLRGSEFYAKNPAIPAAKTAVNLNFDAFEPFGLTKDIVLTGAERTSFWTTVQDVAKRFRYDIKPDPRPEQGSYFRSDHFSLAYVGVPAFSIKSGNEFWGKPAGFGDKIFEEFNAKHYHQPSDEYHDNWDFAGIQQIARFGFALGLDVANQEKLPARIKP